MFVFNIRQIQNLKYIHKKSELWVASVKDEWSRHFCVDGGRCPRMIYVMAGMVDVGM